MTSFSIATNASPSSNNEKISQQVYQPPAQPSPHIPQATDKIDFSETKSSKEQKNIELQRMVQQLYMAQAQVRLIFKFVQN